MIFIHRSPFVVFADDEFYKEYLEEVAGHCNDDSEVVPNHGKYMSVHLEHNCRTPND